MAEVIPDSLSNSDTATNGEKRVFAFLRDMLVPDDEYIVWYEPRVLKRYPDFLVWSQRFGLLAIEVKDWTSSQIRKMSPGNFDLEIGGRVEQRTSPLAQVRDSANMLMSALKKVPSFVHANGPHKDHIRFPVGYAVFWTNISRVQAEEINMASVIPPSLAIFQDDLRLDVTKRDDQRLFAQRLKASFTVWYDFDPLSFDDLKTLRYVIFPEVRVSSVRKLRSEKDEELLKTLDLQQERTAKGIGVGHRILKGVAGSGKTLVLACRAKFLKSVQTRWRVLVVCYNIALSRYLIELIKASGSQVDSDGIDVFHFHGLVKSLTNAKLFRLEDETDEQYDERIGQILLGRIAEGTVQKGIYDAVFVDEGQDFRETWMRGLVQLLNEKSDCLLFCYDPAQNVFGRSKPNWKNAGLKVQGKRPVELQINYRNTAEILDAARKFSGVIEAPANAAEDEQLENTLFPMSIDRHGERPLFIQRKSVQELCVFILDAIDGYIKHGECNWSDIGILYTRQTWMSFSDVFRKMFNERFDSSKLYWATQSRENKLNLDLGEASAKLITIESCKGLEFRVVFIVGLEEMPRPVQNAEWERKLAYVGITRAQDILHVLYISETGYAAELKKLVET